MEFYLSINPFYDFILPLNKKQVDFTCEEVPSGKVQKLNYETLLKTKPEKLPLIENEIIRFERSYDYRPDGLINFVTRFTVNETNQMIKNSVTLYPVTRYEIVDLLEKSGFSAVEFFGEFDRSPVLPSNLPLVVRALKR